MSIVWIVTTDGAVNDGAWQPDPFLNGYVRIEISAGEPVPFEFK